MTAERNQPPRRRTTPQHRQDAAERLRNALAKARALDATRTPGHGGQLVVGVRADDLEWLLAQYTHLPRRTA